MIKSIFQIFPGVGPVTEGNLKNSGIENWDDILERNKPSNISQKIWDSLQNNVPKYISAFDSNDVEFLLNHIPTRHHWCFYPNYFGKIAYLDIETTGLSYPQSHITTIAVFDGKEVHDFVRGRNLNEFGEFIAKFPAICTFYGKGFDVPFIRAELKLPMNQIHFDVCFLLKKVGIGGGLKKIEKRFNISRGQIDGIDGYSAVILWKKFEKYNEERYLNTLLSYNNEDVLNLKYLLYKAYNLICRKNQLKQFKKEVYYDDVENPVEADIPTVKEILKAQGKI